MTTEYLHGVETIEVSDGIRPVRRARTSVIGVIGTAPGADTDIFPINRPVAIPGNTRLAAALGSEGTLPDAIRGIYKQFGAIISIVRVEPGMGANATLAQVIGDPIAQTGVHALLSSSALTGLKPKILIAPGFTSSRPSTGISEIQVNEGGTGYAEPPTVVITGESAIPAKARAVVADGAVATVIVEHPGLGYDAAPAITFVGGGGEDAAATAVLGTTANPVAAALDSVGNRLRAVSLVGGPNTTSEAAISYRGDFGSDRMMVIDPHLLDFIDGENATVPPEAYAAGLQAKMDNERGFWWPFSNQPITGITGVSRPIAANLSDRSSEHNWLNEHAVTTVIRENGFRFFGLRSCSDDPLTAFLSVRRIIDVVRDEVEQSFTWALDRPFSLQIVREVVEAVNAYLRLLVTEGAIVGGRCWLNPDFNPHGNLVQGKLTLDFDIEPVAPIERLTFRIHRNPEYYTEAIEEIVRQLAA